MRDRRPNARKRGFTLVELLVVIAIIGVLVALLLPAVQAAREAARRAQCTSNIKNVVLAMHNFHDSKKHIPYGVTQFRGNAPNYDGSITGKGWIIDILPHLEAQSLYDQLKPGFNDTGDDSNDWDKGKGMQRNEIESLMATRQSILECPSEDAAGSVSTEMWWWIGKPVAVTTYKGVLGDNVVWPQGENGFRNLHRSTGTVPDCHNNLRGCNGVIWRMSFADPLNFRRISDGLSNTLFVGESLPSQDFHSAAYFADGDWASCNIPLNFTLVGLSVTELKQQWFHTRGFASRHPGGVNFARGDGSVTFLSDDIDHNQTLRPLCTRDGGEIAVN
ncbi:DUF1559 domain-containing protein [Pirellulales bacterium]|nr:DUF1559 domain-containing protein [Pirellulales bacterium]